VRGFDLLALTAGAVAAVLVLLLTGACIPTTALCVVEVDRELPPQAARPSNSTANPTAGALTRPLHRAENWTMPLR